MKNKHSWWAKLISCALILLLGVSLSAASAASQEEKRQHIRDISNKTLLKLYSLQPAARGYVENAAGYAVFGNWGVKLLFIGGGTGKGIAVNNSNNQEVFMDMITGTAGFGLGAKTYNAVFIFENEKAWRDFTTNGWQFGGQVTGNHAKRGEVFAERFELMRRTSAADGRKIAVGGDCRNHYCCPGRAAEVALARWAGGPSQPG